MDDDSRIGAMLTAFMPEEYEGQHQLTQTNWLSIELYLLSNNLGLYDSDDGYRTFSSFRAHNERLLAMVRTFGWHRGSQFKTLLASREPTVEAIAEKVFASAVFQMDMEIVKLVLGAGMDPNSFLEVSGGRLLTPLQWAATIANSGGAEMVELLISYKADIELRRSAHSTLFRAISRNNEGVIEVLLRHNAVVDMECLAEATRTVSADLFGWLLASCPGVGLVYDIRIREYRGRRGHVTLLGAAARFGRLEIIKTILRVCPGLVNPRDLEARGGADYFSPISVAITNNHPEALKVLLDAGVDTNFVNGREQPPIERALARRNLRAYRILVESGATITRPLPYKRLHVLTGFLSGGANDLSTMAHLINESARLSHNFTEWSGEVLAEAINENDPTAILLLLNFGATVSAEKVTSIENAETAQYLDTWGALQAILDRNGPVILLNAVDSDPVLTQWLLVRAPVLLNESLYSAHTPLCSAANSRQPELVKLMLSYGASVTDRALFFATRRIIEDREMVESPSYEASEVLHLLLSHFNGAAPSAVAVAAMKRIEHMRRDDSTNQNTDVLQLLLSAGTEPTGTPTVFNEYWHVIQEPRSVLEVAVATGNRAALDILTQLPYHWDTGVFGRALTVACSRPDEDFIDPIIRRKPNMNEEVGWWTPAPGLNYADEVVTFQTALQAAARLQRVLVVRRLLDCPGTDVNYPAKGHLGRTALQHAVENGNMELITMLLNHDADVNSPPAEDGGATALQLAAIKGYIGIARHLLDHRADVNSPGAPGKGRTALEGAAEHGRIDMVHMLLEEGAWIFGDAGERQYDNAVNLARRNGHYAVARMLERFKTKAEQVHGHTSGISVDCGGKVYEEEDSMI